MASETALTLVNKIFLMTGDYDKVATVLNTPADIAEKAIHFLNVGLNDLCRYIDFDILNTSIQLAATGTASTFYGTVTDSSAGAIVSVTVNTEALAESSRKALEEARASNAHSGKPVCFARSVNTSGFVGVDIYPTPAAGQVVTIFLRNKPTEFTLLDNSTTEIMENDLLVLAAIAHMDAYAGIDRGYMQLYEIEKKRRWTDAYKNSALQVIVNV